MTYDLTYTLSPSGCCVKIMPRGTQEDACRPGRRLLPKPRPRCVILHQGGRNSGEIRSGEIADIFLKEAHLIWIEG